MPTTSQAAINFEPWHQLLVEYVNDRGQVDYQRWKATGQAVAQLNAWLATLQSTELSSWPDEDTKLALLINLYNALTIRQVLRKYPIDSVRPTVFGVPNLAAFKLFFSKPVYTLGDRTLSLDNLEHDLIRKQFAEPRIHFALVCASVSCPILRNEAYRPETLAQQLEQSAQDFLNDATKNRYDAASNTLYCSKIFQWYEKDFLTVSSTIPTYVQQYLKQALPSDAAVKYLPYNWQLNRV
ncbi:MAG: DUF547 domain-containing protein [Cyanobacteria bacterium J06634_5]